MKTLRTLLLIVAVCALLLVAGCVSLPTLLSALNPGVIYRVPDTGKTLYLSLDDGPSEATPLILDVLRKHDVKATFFIVTDHIRPEWMQRIRADGHQVAHHMKTTASLGRLSTAQFEADFLAADKALAGYQPVRLFRPPGGSITPEQVEFVKSRDYEVVVGTVFPLDHWLENETSIRMLTRLLATDGGIIILHDTRIRGTRTAAVLHEVIPCLKGKGYRFALLPTKKRP